jgi:HprK-related kinase A
MNSLAMRLGPVTATLETPFASLVDGLHQLYRPELFDVSDSFADFHVSLAPGKGVRRWFRQQARFLVDGESPFMPLPADQALPMFEWGLNYAIAAQAHQYLVVHAAAIEMNGRVAILPGAPGAGKSTLTAALVRRGWRLLSDELALIRPEDGHVVPLARPINLKNRSIDIMRDYAPEAVFSRETHDTAKGTVALMRAPEDSMRRVGESAPVGWIVFPRWKEDAEARMEPWSRPAGLMEIAHNAMNYSLHEERGFNVLANIFEQSGCYRFTYSKLDDAIERFAALAASSLQS